MTGRIFTRKGPRRTALLAFAALSAVVYTSPVPDIVGPARDATAWVLGWPGNEPTRYLWGVVAVSCAVGALWPAGWTGDQVRRWAFTILQVAVWVKAVSWMLSLVVDLVPGPPPGHPRAFWALVFWAAWAVLVHVIASWVAPGGYQPRERARAPGSGNALTRARLRVLALSIPRRRRR